MESSTILPASGSSVKRRELPQYVTLGLWLILLGATWMAWNLDVLGWAWIERYGFVLLGVSLLIKTIWSREYALSLPLTLLTLGLFHLYLDMEGVPAMRSLWPVYFLLIGSSFMASFLVDNRRWFSLMVSLLALMTGGFFISRSYFNASIDALETLRTFWPLTLVVSGIILVALSWVKRRKTGTNDRT